MIDTLTLGTGSNYRTFNTFKTVGTSADGTPITLAGTPALRASINGGDYVNAGLTLSVDHDFNGASQVTGLHRVAIDVDNVTLALASGDTLAVILSAGTVNSVSVAGTTLFTFKILADGLTTQEKTDVRTAAMGTALTESYAADGAAATATQMLYMIQQMLTEASVSGTTLTVKKVDGSTSAATFTLSDATNPTSITRAS